jgi:acetyl esterase
MSFEIRLKYSPCLTDNIILQLDAIVISVDYAKAPRHPYPHALLQLYQVLRWTLPPAARQQGIVADPSKVALLGKSAGGNLVASLSLLLAFMTGPIAKLRQDLPAEFQQVLQVMLYPSLDTGLSYKTRFERASDEVQARSLPVSISQLMEDCYLPPHIDRDCLFVRPTLADDELLASLRLPPSLILTAGMDCRNAVADLYAEKLGRAGVKVTLQEYPQAIHGFSHYTKGANFRPDDVGDCWKRVCEGLREAYG